MFRIFLNINSISYSFRSIANQNGVRYSDSTSYFKKYSSSKCKQTVCLHYGLDFPFKRYHISHNFPEQCKQCQYQLRHKCITFCGFAEQNFGPIQHIFFVIVLFESESKTQFRVLFSSLYLQICIFYFGISEYLNF